MLIFFEIWKSKNQTNLWITCFHVKAGKKWQLLMLHIDIWFSRSFAWEWIKHTLNRLHKQSLFQTKFTTDHWIQYDWHLLMGFLFTCDDSYIFRCLNCLVKAHNVNFCKKIKVFRNVKLMLRSLMCSTLFQKGFFYNY